MAPEWGWQRSIVAKVRVYELAKEFGVESKAVMAKLEEMGEFVRSASSTIEAPGVRRVKEAFNGGGRRGGNGCRARRRRAGSAGGPRVGGPGARPAPRQVAPVRGVSAPAAGAPAPPAAPAPAA